LGRALLNQVARSVTDAFDGFLPGKRYLIIDRDSKYCDAFVYLLKAADVKMVRPRETDGLITSAAPGQVAARSRR
jgi:hypothetical protein